MVSLSGFGNDSQSYELSTELNDTLLSMNDKMEQQVVNSVNLNTMFIIRCINRSKR